MMVHFWKLIAERRATKRYLLDCMAEDKDAMTHEYREKNVAARRSTQYDETRGRVGNSSTRGSREGRHKDRL